MAATTGATPRFEVVTLFCSLAMSMFWVVPQFLDLAQAHRKVLRDNVYIEAPKELGLGPSQCLRHQRCWNGTRHAGQAFEFAVRDDFEVNSFSHGAHSTDTRRRRLWFFCCTATTTWDWEQRWTVSGTDSKTARGSL